VSGRIIASALARSIKSQHTEVRANSVVRWRAFRRGCFLMVTENGLHKVGASGPHLLFAEWAVKQPEQIAVVFRDKLS
jgi:hypothetical protein